MDTFLRQMITRTESVKLTVNLALALCKWQQDYKPDKC